MVETQFYKKWRDVAHMLQYCSKKQLKKIKFPDLMLSYVMH